MSRRFPNEAVCPDCGVRTRATASGELRSHVSQAIAAGKTDAACMDDSGSAQRVEAAEHRRQSKAYRDAYRERQGQTRLPPHLR